MTSDNYQPIECGLHSEYELAIMHGAALNLSWRDAQGEVITHTVKPIDLQTRDRQEFLIVQGPANVIYEIRLDRIISSISMEN